jgi:hypothetical protein
LRCMKLPDLFGRSRSMARSGDVQDRSERLLAESFRLLSQVCGKMAELVEAQRLARTGYSKQGHFLERLDKKPPSDGG